MKTLRMSAFAAGLLVLMVAGTTPISTAHAQGGSPQAEVSVMGGIQALNKNDTALPDNFINIPAAAALTYHLNPTWAVEGEMAWMIPIKRSVDLGVGGTQDRKTPDILAYQASVLGKLPISGTPWTPYLAAGAGAVTFLSNTDSDRFPQLTKSQTAFALNFGAGATYGVGSHWAVRADYRELAAFPSKDTAGLSNSNKADPIWMERGTLGLAYRF